MQSAQWAKRNQAIASKERKKENKAQIASQQKPMALLTKILTFHGMVFHANNCHYHR